MDNQSKATPRPWTHWELKAGSTRTEAEVAAALVAIHNHEALLEVCREASKLLESDFKEHSRVFLGDLQYVRVALSQAIANASK